jgi:hypothetical protein
VLICCAIGRSASARSNLLSALQEKANKAPGADVQLAARLALANLGVRRDENLKLAIESLGGTTTRSCDMMRFMLLLKIGPWAAERFQPVLEKALGADSDTAALAAILAARWGDSGRFAVPAIQRNEITASSASGQAATMATYAFARAKLAAGGSNWLSSDLPRLLGSERVGFDHTVASALLLLSGNLVGQREVPELIGLLSSDAPDVVIGTSKLCWALGLHARGAENQLLKLTQQSRDARVRLWAAMALGTLASEHSLSPLQKRLAQEADDSVRESLETAIRLISLTSQPR